MKRLIALIMVLVMGSAIAFAEENKPLIEYEKDGRRYQINSIRIEQYYDNRIAVLEITQTNTTERPYMPGVGFGVGKEPFVTANNPDPLFKYDILVPRPLAGGEERTYETAFIIDEIEDVFYIFYGDFLFEDKNESFVWEVSLQDIMAYGSGEEET